MLTGAKDDFGPLKKCTAQFEGLPRALAGKTGWIMQPVGKKNVIQPIQCDLKSLQERDYSTAHDILYG